MNVDWSKAPEGATHHVDGGWYKKMVGKWYYWFEVEQGWIDTKYTDPENFSWWGRRVERPATPQWNGEGLPPVGAVVEAFYMGSPQGVVTVRYAGQCMILWSDERNSEQCGAAEHYLFRPIRTPEQLAADEREREIAVLADAIAEMLTGHWAATAPKISEALYSAGYRKLEQPE